MKNILFLLILFVSCSKKQTIKAQSLDLSKPLHKIEFYNYLTKIVQDSFKLELDEETKLPIYKESSQFYFKDVRAIQDTLNQKVVANFQLYKPLDDSDNEMITFVMITFLRKEIDIVEWSYSEHFVQASEDLFETEKINSSYIKQK